MTLSRKVVSSLTKAFRLHLLQKLTQHQTIRPRSSSSSSPGPLPRSLSPSDSLLILLCVLCHRTSSLSGSIARASSLHSFRCPPRQCFRWQVVSWYAAQEQSAHARSFRGFAGDEGGDCWGAPGQEGGRESGSPQASQVCQSVYSDSSTIADVLMFCPCFSASLSCGCGPILRCT